jgi:hypothetical protein
LRRLNVVVLNDHRPQQIDWLWFPLIPFSAIAIVEGEPGVNKSTLLCAIAAAVTRGGEINGRVVGCGPAGVLVIEAEDGLDRLHRRMQAAGADLNRITLIDQSSGDMPRLPEDIETLAREIQQRAIRLVIIDPIAAFAGSLASETSARRIMSGLSLLAARTRAAVVLVRHLNKSGGTNPLHRGAGSIALAAAARVVLLVAEDPADPTRRVLAVIKSNVASEVPSVSFWPVQGDAGLSVQFLGRSDFSAAQLLGDGGVRAHPELDEAIEFLLATLSDGRVRANEVIQLANHSGIAQRTLRRAKFVLGVRSQHEGFGAGSQFHWALPDSETVNRLRARNANPAADHCDDQPRCGGRQLLRLDLDVDPN